jgi:hypothetical protein
VSEQSKFDEWALVEIMGRQRVAGKVTEATLAGGAFLRVDVPDPTTGETLFTRFYAPGSIYCISPVSREVALQLAGSVVADPVHKWDLPQLAAQVQSDPAPDDEGGLF